MGSKLGLGFRLGMMVSLLALSHAVAGNDSPVVHKIFLTPRLHLGNTGIMPIQPVDEAAWIWHPDYQFSAFGAEGRPGGAGLPILVYDFNGDGLNDIVMGSDHGYGLAWFEQKMENGKRSFVQHWIETEYPTFHTMALADLDGDGKPELITGKQLLAHNGGDVGALAPRVGCSCTLPRSSANRTTNSAIEMHHQKIFSELSARKSSQRKCQKTSQQI